jgi:selenocysteine-specific elongation factor
LTRWPLRLWLRWPERPAVPGSPENRSAPLLTLGTAGHIDHGKTALIALLTGTNTDRLREEQERGISIELGYAELVLPDGARLSVIDVPGHERFVRTMVAGATGIDVFLLVVAADDGVMPQTAEHIAILDLLGVTHGVVALTKADLVDEELLDLAAADVREFLTSTPYAECEMVTVSARDGRGADELLAALARAVARVESGRRTGPARLPVDRVFPLKGIGTVVTGTVWRGEIKTGDAVVIEPGGVRAMVRSVQTHDHSALEVGAGSRAGVNLRGVGYDEIERGDWLVAPQLAGQVSRRFDAWVRLLPGAPALRSGDQVRLHHGTAQYVARVAPLEGREIAPGQEAPAVVRVDREAPVQPHDRFILRALSPVATVGGGEVLVTGVHRWHERASHAAFLAAVRAADAGAAVLVLAADRGSAGLTRGELTGAGLGAGSASAALAAAEKAGGLEALRLPAVARVHATPARWFAAGTLAALRAALLAGVAERAAQRPERPFSSAAELAALAPALPVAEVDLLLQDLAADGRLVTGEGGYAAAGDHALDPGQEELAEALVRRLTEEPFAPPTLASLAEELRRPPRELTQVLDVLARRGDVVRADKDLWFAKTAVDDARQGLEEQLTAGEVTLAGFRDGLACGRRSAQALLEVFDREGLTLRRGDVRVARRHRS